MIRGDWLVVHKIFNRLAVILNRPRVPFIGQCTWLGACSVFIAVDNPPGSPTIFPIARNAMMVTGGMST